MKFVKDFLAVFMRIVLLAMCIEICMFTFELFSSVYAVSIKNIDLTEIQPEEFEDLDGRSVYKINVPNGIVNINANNYEGDLYIFAEAEEINFNNKGKVRICGIEVENGILNFDGSGTLELSSGIKIKNGDLNINNIRIELETTFESHEKNAINVKNGNVNITNTKSIFKSVEENGAYLINPEIIKDTNTGLNVKLNSTFTIGENTNIVITGKENGIYAEGVDVLLKNKASLKLFSSNKNGAKMLRSKIKLESGKIRASAPDGLTAINGNITYPKGTRYTDDLNKSSSGFVATEDCDISITIDPGHDTSHYGTYAGAERFPEDSEEYKFYLEYNLTLLTSLAMRDELEKYKGVKVNMIRTSNNTSLRSNSSRAIFADECNSDVFLSIHYNDVTGLPHVNGAEVWIPSLKRYQLYGLAQNILDGLKELGISISRGIKMHRDDNSNGDLASYWDVERNAWYRNNGGTWLEYTDMKNSIEIDGPYSTDVYSDWYGVHIWNALGFIPSMIIESLFLSNDEDFEFVNSREKIDRIGVTHAKSVAKYYGLDLKDEYKVKFARIERTEENKEIIRVLPGTTSDMLAEYLDVEEYSVRDKKLNFVTGNKVGTNYTFITDEKEYNIVKVGDVNGDGQTNTIDALAILKHSSEIEEITDKNLILAGRVNKGNAVNALDALAIQRYVVGLESIELN